MLPESSGILQRVALIETVTLQATDHGESHSLKGIHCEEEAHRVLHALARRPPKPDSWTFKFNCTLDLDNGSTLRADDMTLPVSKDPRPLRELLASQAALLFADENTPEEERPRLHDIHLALTGRPPPPPPTSTPWSGILWAPRGERNDHATLKHILESAPTEDA